MRRLFHDEDRGEFHLIDLQKLLEEGFADQPDGRIPEIRDVYERLDREGLRLADQMDIAFHKGWLTEENWDRYWRGELTGGTIDVRIHWPEHAGLVEAGYVLSWRKPDDENPCEFEEDGYYTFEPKDTADRDSRSLTLGQPGAAINGMPVDTPNLGHMQEQVGELDDRQLQLNANSVQSSPSPLGINPSELEVEIPDSLRDLIESKGFFRDKNWFSVPDASSIIGVIKWQLGNVHCQYRRIWPIRKREGVKRGKHEEWGIYISAIHYFLEHGRRPVDDEFKKALDVERGRTR